MHEAGIPLSKNPMARRVHFGRSGAAWRGLSKNRANLLSSPLFA
jgi:hypothetical protein